MKDHKSVGEPNMTMDLLRDKKSLLWLTVFTLGLIGECRTYIVYSNMPPSQSTKRYVAPFLQRTQQHDYAKQQMQGDYDDGSPEYNFSYNVEDTDGTGDSKWQRESSDSSGIVRGAYSLLEPDGATMRTVRYTAHPIDGFRAVVTRENAANSPNFISAPMMPRRWMSRRPRHP